jgi:creatinine amidohydrolase
MSATRLHQLELMRPHEIRAELARVSRVYLPLGTIEWHAEHLPVGLDALTAHGVCLHAAERGGGVVYPPLHYGTGGGHGVYPWTVMMDGEEEIIALLRHTLKRLMDFGVQQAVLFTGHFADTQIHMVQQLAADWQSAGHAMQVQALAINQVARPPIQPDHAGPFETTMLHALWPQRVDITRLPPKPVRTGKLEEDGWGPQRHVAGHPLWGVVGPDPRDFDPALGPVLLDATVSWLVQEVSKAQP